MINYTKGDITTLDQGILMHGCNCQGVMGAGLAKQIRNKFPDAYYSYLRECRKHEPRNLLGTIDICEIKSNFTIINAFTQYHYGNMGVYADPEAIHSCIKQTILYNVLRNYGKCINMPMIGCGLGGLNFEKHLLPILEDIDYQFNIWQM